MKIRVRLFATLRENREKEMILEFQEEATPGGIIDQLDISREEVAILLINGRDGSLDTLLQEGDTLSIFPPVGGG